MSIQLIYHSAKFKVKKSAAIKKWLLTVIASEKKSNGKIIFTFVDDKEILRINKEFLQHNTYTDIITFDYTEGKKLNAEIFISTERVGENASKLKLAFDREIRRVMVHGILHLCGFKDKSAKDQKEMRKMEDRYLKKFPA
jgi:probable rRNA maturation factor